MLSPFVALRVNSAKHLSPPSQILRFAQDDNRGMLRNTQGMPHQGHARAARQILRFAQDDNRGMRPHLISPLLTLAILTSEKRANERVT